MASSNKAKAGSRSRVKTSSRDNGVGHVRIIAGRWRGRKLAVPDAQGLRPTGDRVRETLFNWLQADVAGAHCLDLFAGSGALGFEALSRYAGSVSFVETNPEACRALRQACKLLGVALNSRPTMLGATKSGEARFDSDEMTRTDTGTETEVPVVHIHSVPAKSVIEGWQKSKLTPLFDLVFIDPPFESGCQWAMLAALTPTLLAEGALVYLESPTGQADDMVLPATCKLVREKRFGDVMARLVRHSLVV